MICATPEVEPAGLAEFAEGAAPGLDRVALFAHDPVNSVNVSRQNILHVVIIDAGGGQRPSWRPNVMRDAEPVLRAAKGWRYPRQGLSDPVAIDAWWRVERGRPDAAKAVAAAAKTLPELAPLLAVVTAELTVRQDAILAGPGDLETLERLEALVAEAEGIELAPAAERIAALLKDPALKNELKARTAYRRCLTLLASDKPKDQQSGREGLTQIATRLGGTVYGKRAAATKP